MAAKRFVRENSNGWEVLAEGQKRTNVRATTRKRAIERAREIVRSHGGGEVQVINNVGKVVDSRRVSKNPRTTKSRS